MDRSSPEQEDDLEQVLSRIRHDKPKGWLAADYLEKLKADASEGDVATEAAATGWKMLPWRRYPSAELHHVAQQFGIGPGHELYEGLEAKFPLDTFTRRSKIVLAQRGYLPNTLPSAAFQSMTWKDLVCVAVLFHIAKKYYELYGNKQMSKFEQEARQRLRDEAERRAAEKAAREAEEAAWRERMEVPPPRVLPWEKREAEATTPATSSSKAPAAPAKKRKGNDGDEGRPGEASGAAKRVCTGLEGAETPSAEQQPQPRPQPAAVEDLDTRIPTKMLYSFLSAAQKDPDSEHVTVRQLLAFVSNEVAHAPGRGHAQRS
ncbi:hypothetical protein KVR01_007376 [Diaporthe batatas]|uniref:uncharacterized protein n=1 Tax=Diaporthe batatas TaxID=748121 RepID=UPI001D04C278|nr:uncharacterized protein KVR01_007376 [Diaporthe batatas]KAG8162898.1 hypothetical protein KVR01_007376 [Diaporthe batatas]